MNNNTATALLVKAERSQLAAHEYDALWSSAYVLMEARPRQGGTGLADIDGELARVAALTELCRKMANNLRQVTHMSPKDNEQYAELLRAQKRAASGGRR